jgi:23S rRNA G2445 N2-methylase RlmL
MDDTAPVTKAAVKPTRLKIFVTSSPGFEELLELELLDLGIPAAQIKKRVTGGVELWVDTECMWLIASHCRIAESIRVRIGTFKAHNFDQLIKG